MMKITKMELQNYTGKVKQAWQLSPENQLEVKKNHI